jgi:hypothetical protein
MPVVQTYWKRWVQIPIRTRKMARLERRTAVKLEKAEAELGQLQAQKQIGEAQLATLPDQAELREEIRGLQAEIRELTDQMALYEVDRRIAQYNDGYSRGTVQQESFASQQRSPGEVTVADDNLLRTTSQNGRNGKI